MTWDIPDNVMTNLMTHSQNGAQRAADGANAYAENARYDYLEGKQSPTPTAAFALRTVDESGSGRSRVTTQPTTAAGS